MCRFHQMSGNFQAKFSEGGQGLQNIPEDKCMYRKTTMSRIISENIAGLRGISENHLGFGWLRRFLDNMDWAFLRLRTWLCQIIWLSLHVPNSHSLPGFKKNGTRNIICHNTNSGCDDGRIYRRQTRNLRCYSRRRSQSPGAQYSTAGRTIRIHSTCRQRLTFGKYPPDAGGIGGHNAMLYTCI